MDRPQSPLRLDAAGDSKELAEAVVAVNRCLDAWHGFVGAAVSRPVTVSVRFAPAAEVSATTIALPESLADSPELPSALLMAALDAVEAAGREWPHEKPRKLWRGKAPAASDGYATDRALEALSAGELLLLARPDDDNGDTIDDYLEEKLADAGIAEPTAAATGPGFTAWTIVPLD
ncbi:hypothetical protein M1L60_36845 [Actinoplanes sp. TRM 88003]|uniref:Uncharacterized protein n=1 Tax=Paractinoplanes aksuensis TaxID=2939490 RepID=A0ABT1E1Z2_9ACTN|nr:hypothetical protein [Actinoplanes aksuensis]MCO8276160.1 hypothetical protein [Actinoplanes aksuensis]